MTKSKLYNEIQDRYISQSARIRELEQKEQGLEKAFSPLLKANEELENRIRELEGIAESVLFEVSRTISPELRERIEQALNKTEQS